MPKYYGISLSAAIKTAYAHNINPEDLVIISNTRFSSPADMISTYGPTVEGDGIWTQEHCEYAKRVWDEGEIIQPRTLMHGVFETNGISTELVGFEPGAAESGTQADFCVGLRGVHNRLYLDLADAISENEFYRNLDCKLLDTLQTQRETPFFVSQDGTTMSASDYQFLKEALSTEKFYLESDGNSRYEYHGVATNEPITVNVPEGTTKAKIYNADTVFLPESVTHLLLKSDNPSIVICATDAQRDTFDLNSSNSIFLSQNDYNKLIESGTTISADSARECLPPLLYNADNEIVGIRNAYKETIETVEIPDGAKIDFRSFYDSLSNCQYDVTVIQDGIELNKTDFARLNDKEPLILSSDETKLMGVKAYYSDITTIELPASVESVSMERLEWIKDKCPNLELITSQNPDLKIGRPDEYLEHDAPVCSINVSVCGSEAKNIVDLLNEQDHGLFLNGSRVSDVHEFFAKNETLTFPEGITGVSDYRAMEAVACTTLELPSTFNTLDYKIVTPSLKTVILSEDTTSINLDRSFIEMFQDKNELPIIVAPEDVKYSLINQCKELGFDDERFKPIILTHEEFAQPAMIRVDDQFPAISRIDTDYRISTFVGETAVCYEEEGGCAKVTFENGSGIILGEGRITTFNLVNGEEMEVETVYTNLKDVDIDKIMTVVEAVEKDGADSVSLSIIRNNENVDDNNDDFGFSLDD